MLRQLEFKIICFFIARLYHEANCGIYNTRNMVGDEMKTIYKGKYFTLDICYYWAYFEVFGTTEDEFNQIEEFYLGLGR